MVAFPVVTKAIIRIIVVLCLGLPPGFAQSQGTPQAAGSALTLDDCVRLAVAAQSPTTIAGQELESARLGVRAARAGFLPQGQFNNGFTGNSGQNGNQTYIALNATKEYVSLFSAALQIDTSGRLRAELSRARADVEAASTSVRLAQRDLKRTVASAYYRLVLTRRLIDVARASLDEARSFEKRTRLLNESGEAARADVVKAAAETAFLEQALNAAELDAKTANHDLASFWTIEVDQRLEVADALGAKPAAPEDALPGTQFLKRLEFNLYDAQKRGFLADYRRARADLLPQTSVVFQYGIDSSRYNWADRGSAVIANLNIPIFDWFRAISVARQSKIRADIVDTNVKMAERMFSRDYQSALARYRMLYDQIAIASRQAELSDENLKLSRVRYEGGEGLALDVVAAQTQAAQAKSNYYTAIANYLNAKADLEVASGK